jgi:Fis family transcriptional regulator
VKKKNVRLNGGNEIGRSVEKSLDEYFRRLDGEPARNVYAMVVGHVERALLAAMMERAGGNQTLAADMLGMNRSTLRAKLAKHKL